MFMNAYADGFVTAFRLFLWNLTAGGKTSAGAFFDDCLVALAGAV
jgi:hypothetical protein